ADHRRRDAPRRPGHARDAHGRLRPRRTRGRALPRVAPDRRRARPRDRVVDGRLRPGARRLRGVPRPRFLGRAHARHGRGVRGAARREQHDPPDDRPRGNARADMAFYTMAFMGTAPFGSLLAGALGSSIGAPATIAAGGVGSVLGAVAFGRRIPALREIVRPIDVEQGILIAEGLATTTALPQKTAP